MKIGYPCKNRTIGCTGDKTFRLKSYSEKRLITTVSNNLHCLFKMLKFNVEHQLFFFRITSDLVPFASHSICSFNWKEYFFDTFSRIGEYIKKYQIRISMHPDQFIVLNSPKKDVVKRSINELCYHADVLDIMGLPLSAKIQLHIGGIYGDKPKSIQRFISTYNHLDPRIKDRLVIENDDTRYHFHDCLQINNNTDIPILIDLFHHTIHNTGEDIPDVLLSCAKTWRTADGILMLDYSQQEPNQRLGKHAETLNLEQFRTFILASKPHDFDIMFEIKDKEKSAIKALKILKTDKRIFKLSK